MPWTFSHPAVVFPIKQSRFGHFLSLPALILGSLSPDLFYSMMWYSAATTAHDLIGWLYTGLPLCLLITIFVQKCFFSPLCSAISHRKQEGRLISTILYCRAFLLYRCCKPYYLGCFYSSVRGFCSAR